MTLLIVGLWQYCVCCIRSDVIQCTLTMVLWSHIGTLMRILAAEPRSTAGLLFPSQCPCETILLTLYSMVWDWRASRAGPIFIIGRSCSIPLRAVFSFLFFPSTGWYCGAQGRCTPLGLALVTYFVIVMIIIIIMYIKHPRFDNTYTRVCKINLHTFTLPFILSTHIFF